ncbi:MAG: metal-sensing transcriptional repressor [Clostridiales bacterium]|nr:metal-sensing transcriptional repressor [Clostridiales bacterium]
MEHSHEHDHDHEHDHEHEHAHCHGEHGHHHSHENTRAVLNRLSRAIGHLQSVKRMIEDGRDCSEVLVQIAAVRSAIDNTGKLILQDHLKHCIVEAAAEGDNQAIEDLCKAIEKYMK